MRYALNSKKMKKIDDYTSEVIKIPSLVLMERAAYEVAAVIESKIQKSDRILAICGMGNNGGDGIAAGRILYLKGYTVAILFIGDSEKATEQTKLQLKIAENLGIPIENNNKLGEYNIIIDAIFGIGLTREVTGIYADIIKEINQNDNMVFAVDIPSGISADDGSIKNTAVKADYTITFGWQKQGLLRYPGAEYAGDITVADIGFPEKALQQVKPDTFYYDSEDLKRLPIRKNNGHKGTFGKVLVIAGSKGMGGAAYLSAKAAYKTGAGLVKVLTDAENRLILQTLLPEALFAAYNHTDGQKKLPAELMQMLEWATVIVIGPGLGQSQPALDILKTVIMKAQVPVIIDADGINLLAKELDQVSSETESRLNQLSKMLKDETILTPHLMEFSRLLNKPVEELGNNLIDTAGECSYNNKLIYTVKDARTVIAHQGQRYINRSGNHGMATGGSGDVLTGIIAALVAQGLKPYDAACLGVYIHGLAGDFAAKEKGSYSIIASDILDSIEDIMKTE
jgi:hydroxyethylthiazole kinase-like uncharacterized protein yjeF